jgi:molecular chaperone DnaJ
LGGGFSNVSDIFSAFSDVFGDFFGGGMGGRAGSRGGDLETGAQITLAEVATGVSKELQIKRRMPCGACDGSGAAAGAGRERCAHCRGRGQVVHSQGFMMLSTTCPVCCGEGEIIRTPCHDCDGAGLVLVEDKLQVNIPAGVEDGMTLRLAGRGEGGLRGGRSGHLYVAVHVEPDARFERDGADLHSEASVAFPQLALGDRIEVETMDGMSQIKIDPGSQPGDTIVLQGKGLPRLRERGVGHLTVHLRLVVPKTLTAEQEQHLRAFAASSTDPAAGTPAGKGRFFRRKNKSKN